MRSVKATQKRIVYDIWKSTGTLDMLRLVRSYLVIYFSLWSLGCYSFKCFFSSGERDRFSEFWIHHAYLLIYIPDDSCGFNNFGSSRVVCQQPMGKKLLVMVLLVREYTILTTGSVGWFLTRLESALTRVGERCSSIYSFTSFFSVIGSSRTLIVIQQCVLFFNERVGKNNRISFRADLSSLLAWIAFSVSEVPNIERNLGIFEIHLTVVQPNKRFRVPLPCFCWFWISN